MPRVYARLQDLVSLRALARYLVRLVPAVGVEVAGCQRSGLAAASVAEFAGLRWRAGVGENGLSGCELCGFASLAPVGLPGIVGFAHLCE